MRNRLLAAALATATVVAALIGLGVWQLDRLAWKRGLLAEIDRAEAAPALPLADNPVPFSKVSVTGVYAHPIALYGSEVRDTPKGPRIGAYFLEPLQRPGAQTVIVNRGWIPTDEAKFTFIDPVPTAYVEGYIREPELPGRFSAADDPATLRFYSLDPAAIGAALGVADPAPFTLVQLRATPPGVYPASATSLPRPSNDHLSYAITWFSLATVAAVIFTLQARKVLRT